jgi:hypothetical protein
MRCTRASHIILLYVACPTYPHFSTLSQNFTIFGKKVTEYKMVFFFSIAFIRKICHYKKNSVRYYQKCTSVFMLSTSFACQILMKLEFSRQILEILKYQISRNPSSARRDIPCGRTNTQTDGRTGVSKLYSRLAILRTRLKTTRSKWKKKNV